MQSFRTEIENPIVERDIIELERNNAKLANYYSNRVHTQLLEEQNKTLQLLINKLSFK